MSLNTLRGAKAPDTTISRTIARGLDTQMTRKEFLKMSGALMLTAVGASSLFQTYAKYTRATSPNSLLTQAGSDFGSSKFGG